MQAYSLASRTTLKSYCHSLIPVTITS